MKVEISHPDRVVFPDDGADRRRNPVRTQRESVLSGRTIDEVAGEVRA